MALINMAVYDTVENGRTDYTQRTLNSLYQRVDFSKHRLVVIDNDSCNATKTMLSHMQTRMAFTLITNQQNVGTANAINQGLALRRVGENAIKIDNDVVVHSDNWVDLMEEAIEREPHIGIIGLKRRDLDESPYRTDWAQSKLHMIPQQKGQKWIVVEKCRHIMGTCTMFSSALIDRIGGLYQLDGIYGFDDSLYSIRSSIAGFWNVFVCGVDIDHIDTGGDDYTQWKIRYATEFMPKYTQAKNDYQDGVKDIYHKIK
jgi:GT2 family glycosyltransferase